MYPYAMSTRAITGHSFDTRILPERATAVDINRWMAMSMDDTEYELPEMTLTSNAEQADDVDDDGWSLCGWCITACAGERHLAHVYSAVYAHCDEMCQGQHVDQYENDLEHEGEGGLKGMTSADERRVGYQNVAFQIDPRQLMLPGDAVIVVAASTTQLATA